MIGGFGGDHMLGGEENDLIDGAAAGDHIAAGPGDDTVHAYAKDAARIDCGPGKDTVRLGNNRNVLMRHCEKKQRL